MKIYCAYDELLTLADLDQKRNPKNANTHGAAQIAAIAQVFEGNGIRHPIVVSNRSGFIIKGHGRLDAAMLLGYEKFPVDFQDYESEEAELADMVADNRLAELSEIDEQKLTAVLNELIAAGHDIELGGFTAEDFEKLKNVDEEIANSDPIPKMQLQAFEHYDYLIFMFRDIRDWLRVLQLLKVTKVDFSISRKTQKIGIGRVINGKTLLNRLDDTTRHNVERPEQPRHDAPTAQTGDARSAN